MWQTQGYRNKNIEFCISIRVFVAGVKQSQRWQKSPYPYLSSCVLANDAKHSQHTVSVSILMLGRKKSWKDKGRQIVDNVEVYKDIANIEAP